MRVSVAWLREWVDAPADPAVLTEALVRIGIEVEDAVDLAATVDGPLVVGAVREIEELTGFKKRIRYCQVDTGGQVRGIICGAFNFAVGDLVVVALPGTVLPGGFEIAARRTYDRISDGMICSARELGIGDDHSGIIVLPPGAGQPGDPARPLVGLDDVVLDLEVTPDRGYCLSVRCIARELSHALGVEFRDPALAIEAPGATDQPPYPVTVEDEKGCDRFAARLVRGIDPSAPTPPVIRNRLAVAGIRSISLAVDITNYLMLELGQPMHAFDPNRLSGPLLVRRARAGERLTTLDGVDRKLDPEDMVICDDTGPISLAAVMGGENSEMRPDSVDVLFEAAHWDPVMVSRTARRHRLLSEAAKRWERGVDPQLALVALEKAVRLLIDHAGGELDQRVLDLDAVAPPLPVTVPADLPSRVAGVAYEPARVTEILTEIGCGVEPVGDALVATPPTWRPDLLQPADFAEEVVRLDGYGKVPSVLPVAPPGRGLTPQQRRKRAAGRALAEGAPPAMGVQARPSPEDLAAAERFVPEQPWHVAVVLAGDVEPAGWWGSGRSAIWADAVEAARITLAASGVPVEVRAGRVAPWHPGRCAEILVDGGVVGYAGELHPAVCAALDLPRRTAAMELDLDALPLPGV